MKSSKTIEIVEKLEVVSIVLKPIEFIHKFAIFDIYSLRQ